MRCVRNWRWVNLWNRNLRIKQKKAVCTPENRGANPIISRRRANNNSCHGMEWVISYLFVSLFHNLSRNVKYITSTVQNYKFPCIKGKRSQPSLETINSGQTKASLPVGFGFQDKGYTLYIPETQSPKVCSSFWYEIGLPNFKLKQHFGW